MEDNGGRRRSQKLSGLAHAAETIRGLREALAQVERAEAVSLSVFDKRFRTAREPSRRHFGRLK
jgi:hypothetical protein